MDAGFSESKPVGIFFKPGVVGHHKFGRAADIYAVAGVGLDRWKERWDAAIGHASRVPNAEEKQGIANMERKNNLGWRLYKAPQVYGRRGLNPTAIQSSSLDLWTRSEGPWKYISDSLAATRTATTSTWRSS